MRLNINATALVFFIMFALGASVIKGVGPTTLMVTLLSVTTFLFGIFGAFVLQDRQARFNDLKSVLRRNDASFISMYRLSGVFGKDVQMRMQAHLDAYLVATIDYKLDDYYRSNKEFLALIDFTKDMKPKNNKELLVYEKLVDCAMQANYDRGQVELLVRNKMLRFEGITLVGLLAIMIFSIFYINDNSLPSIIISILLTSISLVLMLMISGLDHLSWKEQMWVWKPLEQLFEELDLLPYYPEQVLQSKRMSIPKGTKARVAHYPNKYPDKSGKEIRIVEG